MSESIKLNQNKEEVITLNKLTLHERMVAARLSIENSINEAVANGIIDEKDKADTLACALPTEAYMKDLRSKVRHLGNGRVR